MSTSYTPSIGLSKPASGDRTWDVPILASLDTLDALAPLGGLSVGLAENPSASLNVKVSAGSYRKADGTVGTYAGTSSQATTTTTTNYVYLLDNGTLTVNTTGFPAASHVRLATVVAGATTITSITDARISLASLGVTVYLALSGGTFADAGGVVTVGTGTTNGTKIGASTSDKIGFFNATPVVQPANTVELVALLVSLGLRATGGNPALNLGTGALTCGAANHSGLTTISDAQNVAVGTTTGTKIGTATSQKLGFFNATPIVQPTMGAATASGTYTATEQAMLQAVYNAVRNLGLGS